MTNEEKRKELMPKLYWMLDRFNRWLTGYCGEPALHHIVPMPREVHREIIPVTYEWQQHQTIPEEAINAEIGREIGRHIIEKGLCKKKTVGVIDYYQKDLIRRRATVEVIAPL